MDLCWQQQRSFFNERNPYMDIHAMITAAAAQIPRNLLNILSSASDYLPSTVEMLPMLKFVLILMTASLGVGIIGRLALGRQSKLNHTLSCSMGILAIYVITIVVYTFQPWNLEALLSPLPFTAFWGDRVMFMPFHGSSFSVICSQVLSMVVLAFLINLADALLPQGERILTWYLLRFLTVVLAMLLHLGANWLINMYLPALFVTYAPTVLLVVLVSALLVGLARVVLGVALTAVNPIIGGIYAFFFAGKIGIQLTKSVFTTVIVCGVLYVLEYLGYTVIIITKAALLSYLPLLLSLLVLWFLLGHEL